MGPFCIETVLEDLHMGQNTLAQEELDSNRDEWRRIFEAIGHPTITVDAQHNVRAANRATLVATGKSQEQLRHLKCYQIFHGTDRPPQDCPLQRMLETGRLETLEMELEVLGGVYLVSCTPVLDDNGHFKEAIHIATDITDRKRAEEGLRQSEERLQLTLEAAQLGMWDFNPTTFTDTHFNERWFTMLGYSPDELPHSSDTWLQLIHPDDLEQTRQLLDSHLKGETDYLAEFRLKGKNGRYRWIQSVGRVVAWDRNGTPERMIGIHIDITGRKEAEKERKGRGYRPGPFRGSRYRQSPWRNGQRVQYAGQGGDLSCLPVESGDPGRTRGQTRGNLSHGN